jgi:membrane-bound lytic murein transglycosylase B
LGWSHGRCSVYANQCLAYGVDANKDGKVNLWNDKEDIYASAANFLSKLGWKKGEKWGREALIPKSFDYRLTGLKNEKTVNEWAALGVLRGTVPHFQDLTLKPH